MPNKDYGNLVIEGKFDTHILGTVIVLDLKKNKLCEAEEEGEWIEKVLVNTGDTFSAEGARFEITKIECARNLFDSKIRKIILLAVNQIL